MGAIIIFLSPAFEGKNMDGDLFALLRAGERSVSQSNKVYWVITDESQESLISESLMPKDRKNQLVLSLPDEEEIEDDQISVLEEKFRVCSEGHMDVEDPIDIIGDEILGLLDEAPQIEKVEDKEVVVPNGVDVRIHRFYPHLNLEAGSPELEHYLRVLNFISEKGRLPFVLTWRTVPTHPNLARGEDGKIKVSVVNKFTETAWWQETEKLGEFNPREGWVPHSITLEITPDPEFTDDIRELIEVLSLGNSNEQEGQFTVSPTIVDNHLREKTFMQLNLDQEHQGVRNPEVAGPDEVIVDAERNVITITTVDNSRKVFWDILKIFPDWLIKEPVVSSEGVGDIEAYNEQTKVGKRHEGMPIIENDQDPRCNDGVIATPASAIGDLHDGLSGRNYRIPNSFFGYYIGNEHGRLNARMLSREMASRFPSLQIKE